MTREELRDYVEEQRSLNNIPYHVYSALIDGIDTLEQEPKTGHWMGGSYDYICSNCKHSLNDLAQSIDYIPFSKSKYCPNCGAKMVEPQESEDNNVSI